MATKAIREAQLLSRFTPDDIVIIQKVAQYARIPLVRMHADDVKSEHSCRLCKRPISVRIANSDPPIPVTSDLEKKKALQSGYWIYHNGWEKSWDPQQYHLQCFQTLKDSNFPICLAGLVS